MNTPLQTRTGVRIGSRVDKRPPQVPFDRDALRLQDALLGNARRTDWDGVAIVLIILAAIGLIAWVTA